MTDGDNTSGNTGRPQGDASASQWWRFSLDTHSADFDFIGEAIKLLSSTVRSEEGTELAKRYIAEEVGRRMMVAGLRRDQVESIADDINDRAMAIVGLIRNEATVSNADRSKIEQYIVDITDEGPQTYASWITSKSRELGDIASLLKSEFDEILDDYDNFDVGSPQLRERLKDILIAHLEESGIGAAEAARIAKTAMRDFQRAVGKSTILSPRSAELAIKLAMSLHRAMKQSPTDPFRAKAKLALPDEAPALWERKNDRLPNETPIEFLRRVWKPWLEADVLYQDDLKRLNPKLSDAIRSHCRHKGLKAPEHLPPPKSVRTDRALADAVPGSHESYILHARLRARRAYARKKSQAPQQP